MLKKVYIALIIVLGASMLQAQNLFVNSDCKDITSENIPKYWQLRGSGKGRRIQLSQGIFALELEPTGKKSLWSQNDLKTEYGKYYILSVLVKADKNTLFSVYIESRPGMSYITRWIQGQGKWQMLKLPFQYLGKNHAKGVLRARGNGKVIFKAPTLTVDDKRLTNGDFSEGLNRWTRISGTVKVSVQKQPYGNCLELKSLQAGRNPRAVFKGIQLYANTKYLLSYEVKGALDKKLCDPMRASWFRVYPSIDGKALEGTDQWLDCFATWQKKYLSFKPEKDCVVRLECEVRAPGQAWFDNIALQEVKIESLPIKIVLDPPAAYRNAIYSSQKDIKNISGTIHLNLSGARKIYIKLDDKNKTFDIRNNEVKFELPAPSAYGVYPLLVEVYDSKNKVIARTESDFNVYPPAKREVTFRKDHVMLVDGKPFFPLVSWSVRGKWSQEDKAASLAKAGFNAWFTNASDFDLAASHGLFTFLSVCRVFTLESNPKTAERKKSQDFYLEQIKKISSHPALLGYFTTDEPAWRGQSPLPLIETYNIIRKIDPYKPVWINEAPRGKINDLRQYVDAFDVYGIDIYPVPSPSSHSGLQDKTITSVGKYADICREIVDDRKPVWMALQGVSWGSITGKNPSIYPNHQENRFMAYDAILHGATGLTWWGINWRIDNRDFLETLGKTVREIRALSAVLVSAKTDDKLANNKAQLCTMVRKYKGVKYYFAVNESKDEFTATFTGDFPPELTVLFENRQVKTNGKRFVDHFKAYDVHVYSEKPEVPAPLPLPEMDMAQYKVTSSKDNNFVKNPDFEILNFYSGVVTPEYWRFRPAKSGELVVHPEQKGKCAIRLSPEKDKAALCIGTLKKIDIGQTYTCTVRIKTQPGATFKVYVERSKPKFQSSSSGWRKGNGKWQDVSFDFNFKNSGENPYIVLICKGKGCLVENFEIIPESVKRMDAK